MDKSRVFYETSKTPSFDELKEAFERYIFNENDRENIEKAYLYAKKKHEGQFRKSGEEYIYHPVCVAIILAKLIAGPSTIIAGLLHDVVEDTNTPIEEITELFGEDVSSLVDSLTKIQRLKLSRKSEEDFEAEDHRKIFIGMAKDVRVIIIKLADRLHNLRTIDSLKRERQIAISRETIDVFVPIAHRLGMFNLKSQLEDLSFKYLEPEIYNDIYNKLNEREINRQESLNNLKKKIADILYAEKIPFEMEARVKTIYSIYKKIYLKNHKFDDIYDILAIRIITKTELNCYEILGLIHSYYQPLPGRFKDYIAMPKPNMYQSLHTTVIANDGHVYEIQIRTKEMDEIAETGVAAHWRYKEGTNYNSKKEQQEIEEKLHWFREFHEITDENAQNPNTKEYLDNISKDIFESNVYVFTPKGKVIELPNGSTPIDFAYKIHTKVGDSAIGAMVNGTLVALNTVLKTSDIVEIKTSQNSPGPSEGWLKFVKTNSAINNIKKYLAKKNAEILKDEKIERGKTIALDCFREIGYTEIEMNQLLNTNKVLNNYHFSTINELFVGIASRNPTISNILSFLKLRSKNTGFVFKNRERKTINSAPVLIDNNGDLYVELAKCCSPIPGDDIVGYITKGDGVTVHLKNCPNVVNKAERIINANWDLNNILLTTYPVDIEIKASDRNDLLVDIMNCMTTHKVTLSQLNAKSHPSTATATINVTLYAADNKHLNDIFSYLKNIKGVYEINRVIH